MVVSGTGYHRAENGLMAEGVVRRNRAKPERAGRELGYQVEVGMYKGMTVQVEWALEEEVASSPVSGEPDLS